MSTRSNRSRPQRPKRREVPRFPLKGEEILSPADIDRSKQRAQSHTSALPQFQSPLQFPRVRQERFTPPTTVNLDSIERADNSGVPPTVLFGDFTPDQAHFPISPSPRDPNPPFTVSPHAPAFVYVKDKPVPSPNSTSPPIPGPSPSSSTATPTTISKSIFSLPLRRFKPISCDQTTQTQSGYFTHSNSNPNHKRQSNPTRPLLYRRPTPPET